MSDAAICFVGPIRHPASQNLRNLLCDYANQEKTKVTLYMSSGGGSLMEGFALYNLMVGLPYELITHNIGVIHSIANIVFLAGAKRFASPQSNFLLHNFTMSYGQETLTEPQMREKSLDLEESRAFFVEIFKSHTNFTAKDFDSKKFFTEPSFIRPAAAQKAGIIHHVQQTAIPAGTHILNVVQ